MMARGDQRPGLVPPLREWNGGHWLLVVVLGTVTLAPWVVLCVFVYLLVAGS
jgi:hypothetical protein